jgi:hypothetical protein
VESKRGFVYAHFNTIEEAEAALLTCIEKRVTLGGRLLHVEESVHAVSKEGKWETRRAVTPQDIITRGTRALYISNLPFESAVADIHEMFRGLGHPAKSIETSKQEHH